MLRLLFIANIVPNWLILFALMMEAIRSSKTSVLTRRDITKDGILQE
jgi:hypothetical protein